MLHAGLRAEWYMPRKPRVHAPGGIYHVILRGNARQPLFFTASDRRRWMRLLADGVDRYECRIHAFCWMTNHVHMAVQVSELPLGRFIGWAASQYARATNRRLGRSGHLFERRYRGNLVTTDSYLLQLVRYIHRNPVAAGIVDRPSRYAWSSHRAYLGNYKPGLLTTGLVLRLFSNRTRAAIDAYRAFMHEAIDDDDHPSFESPENQAGELAPSIDVKFGERARKPGTPTSLSELVQAVCEAHNISEAELASPRRTRTNNRVRAEIAVIAQRDGIATLHEVAERFKRSDSALSHAVRRLLDDRR